MLSRRLRFIETIVEGSDIKAMFRNHWGIGFIQPFSSLIGEREEGCHALWQALRDDNSISAWQSKRALADGLAAIHEHKKALNLIIRTPRL